MILVVSDSSPLNFLIRLGHAEVLHHLFGMVLIPPQVAHELSHPRAPEVVRMFLASQPPWLVIRAPLAMEDLPKLDLGEAAAISLAIEVGADLVLLDDGDARRLAALRGLAITGLLGILERSDQEGLLDLAEVARQLPMDYRIDRALIDAALERCRKH